MKQHIVLVRHGQTEWSLSGQHTGMTDIPLTEHGKREAELIAPILKKISFSKIFSSPLQRALTTSLLAGFPIEKITIDPDLVEWNYGKYEGLTSKEINKHDPDWTIFTKGAPEGESVEQITARADRVIHKLMQVQGNIALFSHGHFLRVLGARWIHLPASHGQLFSLSTGSLSYLGYEKTFRALNAWNTTYHIPL